MEIALTQYVPGLVSVIVPVYNRERLVAKTVDSILCQSYPDVEIVAVNDGSTDGSLSVLTGYAQSRQGKIKVIDQVNSGQVKARNCGIRASRGEFIGFLDSDDTWEKEKLSLQIPLFKGNVGLVYSGINEVDADGNVTRTVYPEPGLRGDIYGRLLVRNRMTGGSVVVSRRALDEVGLFDESFRAAENWDLWIRISRCFTVDFIDQPLVNYLKHHGNMSQDGGRMAEATWSILQKHLPGFPEEEQLRSSYLKAYSDYYYRLGVQCFGEGDYRKARHMFRSCWKYIPGYKDSVLRTIRTLVGKDINGWISRLKRESGIGNRESGIGNRESGIGNRGIEESRNRGIEENYENTDYYSRLPVA